MCAKHEDMRDHNDIFSYFLYYDFYTFFIHIHILHDFLAPPLFAFARRWLRVRGDGVFLHLNLLLTLLITSAVFTGDKWGEGGDGVCR